MVKITNRISVDGFDTKEEFNEWLNEQEEKQPNESVMKMFKWFLMKVEKADKNKEPNYEDVAALEKYAKKVIERKLMSEDNVIKYLIQVIE